MGEIRIVLAGPRESRNVGAVCRAMKTMGLRALTIAGSPSLDLGQAAVLAVHASDVLRNAVFCATLQEAVRDATLVAGVTRREGRWRKTHSITPEALADRVSRIEGGTAAVVFGNEESGLSDDELALCHLAVHIPSSPDFPSLNLSHAVQVVAYVLFRGREPGTPSAFTPLRGDQVDRLVQAIIGSLRNIGLMSRPGPRGMAVFWRDILARAQLSAAEAARLEGIFRKISGLIARKGIEE